LFGCCRVKHVQWRMMSAIAVIPVVVVVALLGLWAAVIRRK
jgi:hypothetical protein